ncbi:uncharacterized protein LOC135074090 [Ostrinia nubilalis]|uniref:uncharacterized protein LOC135074090 n=1 Tax=Ostrinia nubilalis TaxID=29057 RepID=UPI00308231A8
MGGKSKQSQRTKNNARPSSSGRSAELLNSVTFDQSIMGGKMMPLFPTFTSPALEQGLTAEFSVCIKKLNKKDPITKTKALQELSELVNNSKVDDVVAALPSWAHFYKILAVDTDCKVREAAQACHLSVARACGRRMAPQLRQLVPAWLQAQHDEHAPAQAHAHNSLAATFPENKLPEVISFCKAEVIAHLLENITGSGDKVVMSRIESAEERSLQQQRLVASSLQGLRFLAARLPPAQHAWLWAELEPLFAAPAFWKYPTHAAPQVRCVCCRTPGSRARGALAAAAAAGGQQPAGAALPGGAPAARAARLAVGRARAALRRARLLEVPHARGAAGQVRLLQDSRIESPRSARCSSSGWWPAACRGCASWRRACRPRSTPGCGPSSSRSSPRPPSGSTPRTRRRRSGASAAGLQDREPEERSLQQQRLVASSLQGLRFLAARLPPAQHAWLWAELEPLFAAPAFWKYPTHAAPQVRCVCCRTPGSRARGALAAAAAAGGQQPAGAALPGGAPAARAARLAVGRARAALRRARLLEVPHARGAAGQVRLLQDSRIESPRSARCSSSGWWPATLLVQQNIHKSMFNIRLEGPYLLRTRFTQHNKIGLLKVEHHFVYIR